MKLTQRHSATEPRPNENAFNAAPLTREQAPLTRERETPRTQRAAKLFPQPRMDLTRQSRNQNGARLCLKDQPQRVREPADSGNFERPRANQAAATGAPHTVALRKFASMNKTFTDK